MYLLCFICFAFYKFIVEFAHSFTIYCYVNLILGIKKANKMLFLLFPRIILQEFKH